MKRRLGPDDRWPRIWHGADFTFKYSLAWKQVGTTSLSGYIDWAMMTISRLENNGGQPYRALNQQPQPYDHNQPLSFCCRCCCCCWYFSSIASPFIHLFVCFFKNNSSVNIAHVSAPGRSAQLDCWWIQIWLNLMACFMKPFPVCPFHQSRSYHYRAAQIAAYHISL